MPVYPGAYGQTGRLRENISSFRYPYLRRHPAVLEGLIMQVIVAAGGATVAGSVHLDLQQQRIMIGLKSAHFGDEFRRFPVHHLAIVEAGGRQHGGIIPLRHSYTARNRIVIVELKSIETLSAAHRKQIQTYLRLTGAKLGYLLNFGAALMKDGIVRAVNGLEGDRLEVSR
jgi:PD-(D/E)XK nuclease superfamily